MGHARKQRRPPVLPEPPGRSVERVDTSPGTELDSNGTNALLEGGAGRETDDHAVAFDGDAILGIRICALFGAACWLALWLLYVAVA